MSVAWVAVGATVVSAGVSYYNSEQDRKRAEKEAEANRDSATDVENRQLDMQQEQLDMQREQYDIWKDVYGDLQEDLGEYYKNMTGSSLLPKQLETIEANYTKMKERTQTSLAQKGLDGQGIDGYVEMTTNLEEARAKAQVENSIDDQIKAQQTQFLGLGLGRDTSIINGMGNTVNTMGGIMQNGINANTLMYQQNQQARADARNATNTSLGVVSGALSGINYNPQQQSNPTPTSSELNNAEQNGAF